MQPCRVVRFGRRYSPRGGHEAFHNLIFSLFWQTGIFLQRRFLGRGTQLLLENLVINCDNIMRTVQKETEKIFYNSPARLFFVSHIVLCCTCNPINARMSTYIETACT
jgi:hypothetical protein